MGIAERGIAYSYCDDNFLQRLNIILESYKNVQTTRTRTAADTEPEGICGDTWTDVPTPVVPLDLSSHIPCVDSHQIVPFHPLPPQSPLVIVSQTVPSFLVHTPGLVWPLIWPFIKSQRVWSAMAIIKPGWVYRRLLMGSAFKSVVDTAGWHRMWRRRRRRGNVRKHHENIPFTVNM